MIATRLALAFALTALVTGCAGGKSNLTADTSRYPISLSRGVRDADGELVGRDRITKVGTYHHTETGYAVLYGTTRLRKANDISSSVNRQVLVHGGDAIVNLRIRAQHCGLDLVLGLTWLPFWPGCVHVDIVGDIIKVASKSGAVADVQAVNASRQVQP